MWNKYENESLWNGNIKWKLSREVTWKQGNFLENFYWVKSRTEAAIRVPQTQKFKTYSEHFAFKLSEQWQSKMLLTKRLSLSQKKPVHKCENASHFHHANCCYCNKILIRLHLELLYSTASYLFPFALFSQTEKSYVIGCSTYDAEKFSGNFKFIENFRWEINREVFCIWY